MSVLWLVPDIRHQKLVFFRKDPYNLFVDPGKGRVWLFDFRFEGGSLFVDGRPNRGSGEARAFFSFSLERIGEGTVDPCSGLEWLESCRFRMFVRDIYTTVRGAHIGSYIFNKVLGFVRLTAAFAAEATVEGRLAFRNEADEASRARRRLFWESFGIELREEENRLVGDLKAILAGRIKDLPDVEEVSLERLIFGREFPGRSDGGC